MSADSHSGGKNTSVWTEPLGVFVDQLGNARPTPGGGAIAALSACHAAALLKMVLEIASNDGLEVKDQIRAVQSQLDELQHCVDEDIAAFDSFIRARNMPQATEAETKLREEALADALRLCTETPLAAAKTALGLVPLATGLGGLTPHRVLSDLGAALLQLDAALAGLLLNADINLMGKDGDPRFEPLRLKREIVAAEIASAHGELLEALVHVSEKIRG